MQFNSIEYLIFLPTLFLLYWFVFKDKKAQNLLIVVAISMRQRGFHEA